jgi:hypothetical protein
MFGELAHEIKAFEAGYEVVNKYCPCLGQSTRTYGLKQVIDSYRNDLQRYSTDTRFSEKIRKATRVALSLLEKVLIGETTLKNELAKLNPNNKWPVEHYPTELFVLLGNFDVVPAAETIDQTVRALYLQNKKAIQRQAKRAYYQGKN